jgi:hypothetical protein
MKGRLAAASVVAAISGLAIVPAIATADTITIGSALQHPDTPALCTNCVGVQRSQAGGESPNSLVSHVNGLVTEWAVRTSDAGATQTFRILRPAGGTSYTGAGTSASITVPPGTVDSTLHNASPCRSSRAMQSVSRSAGLRADFPSSAATTAPT